MLPRLLLLSALLLTLVSACRLPRLGAGKGRWKLVETEHFNLYTDLRREDAENRARELERLLSALEQSGWEANGALPLKLNLVILQRLLEFERYGKGDLGGYEVPDLLFEPWVVMPAPEIRSDLSVAAHELTHYISFQALSRQPRWFSEGLASYFESARFAGADTLVIGGVPKSRFNSLRALGVEKPSDLLAGTKVNSEARFYGSAWLLVHYLMTEHPDAFVAYQQALAAGLDDKNAWSTAFPSLPPHVLDKAVSEYLLTGEYATFEVPVRTPNVALRTRTLTLADEHALQAVLWMSCFRCSEGERARAVQHIEQALSADPMQPQAMALSVLNNDSDKHEDLERARAMVQAHPEHWLAWIALGFVAGQSDVALPSEEADMLLERMLTLAPKQAYAWAFAGYHHLRRGAFDQARSALQEAQRLQPTNPSLLSLCAIAFSNLGDCARAERIVARLETAGHASLSEPTLTELRTNVAACTPQRDATVRL